MKLMNKFFQHIILISISLIICAPNCATAEPELKILFIGNSYVGQNNLPRILKGMLKASGINAHVDDTTGPGWTLSHHVQARRTLRKLKSHDWDYVILQEQSIIPSINHSRETRMDPAVRALKDMHKGKTLLFLTWGRKNGLKENGFTRYEDMQDALTYGYDQIARKYDLSIAPAGEAFRVVLKKKPFYPLWKPDGSHPSYQGSYLSACVFYQIITRRSPVGNRFEGEINQNARLFLQKAAESTLQSQYWR